MFSTTFRYALIALVDLAQSQSSIQASSLAIRYSLSRNYMATVLAELRRIGWISSQKGNKGGYSLIVNPTDLTILEIYKAIHGSGVIPWQEAVELRDASLGDAWLNTLAERWDQELETTTLQHLIERNQKI